MTALTVLLGACSSVPQSPLVSQATPAPPSLPTAPPRVALAPAPSAAPPAAPQAAPTPPLEPGDHAFAARLYASMAGTEETNLILSPASARVALGMAMLGARGDTAREMADVLGLSADSEQAGAEMSASVRAWGDRRDPKVKLAIADALFGQRGWPFEASYTAALKDGFAAPFQTLDFAGDSDGAMATINRFAASHTGDQITGLLKPGDLTSQTRLAIVNAIWFRGEWKTGFPAGNTAPGTFHVSPTRDVTGPMMHVQGYFAYGETADAQVVALPYGAGTYSMVVVMPRRDPELPTPTFAALERAMSGATIDKWFGSLRASRVNVTLPRFEIESRVTLEGALAGMGMRRAFDEGAADFGGITAPSPSRENLFLSHVIQKAKVKVDEKGTIAAAVTVVTAAAPPSAPPPVPVFAADQPFLYFIRDGLGNVLFMGRVVEP